MTNSKEQLLELTRCGLWGNELDTTLFSEGVDWVDVLRLAKEQTLVGVVSSGIEKLPLSLQPKRAEALRLHQFVTLSRQQQRHQIDVLAKLLEIVHKAGVERPVLLKGLGVGLNYLDPTLRQCGDIDLYVGEKHYFKVWDYICSEFGIDKRDKTDLHFDFKFMDIDIEIHRYAVPPGHIAFNKKEFIKWSVEQLEGVELREVSIEGTTVYLPPYNFDFIFIFYHTWRHFLTGGVGLRQLSDWSCYVMSYSDKIDFKEADRLISLFKLERAVSLFATIAVKALGVSDRRFLKYANTEDKLYKSALDRFWSRGNFGYYNVDLKRRNKAFIIRKSLAIRAMFHDMIYLMSIDWHYAIRFYSANFYRNVKLTFRK